MFMEIGSIELKWLGHSSFLINVRNALVHNDGISDHPKNLLKNTQSFFGNSKNIYIDPCNIPFAIASEKADIMLITHSHHDHCSIKDMQSIVKDGTIIVCPANVQSKIGKLNKKIDIKILEPWQELELEGIKIKAVPAYNINKKFHEKAEQWNGYIIELDGNRVYHAGDTDLIPEMSNLGKIDVALLPVGGGYTMNAQEAARATIFIKPRIAIPMHYGTIIGSIEDALRFVELCEQEGIKAEVLKVEE